MRPGTLPAEKPWYCEMMTIAGAERTDLKGMTAHELEAFFARWGKERYRARQVSRWIYAKLRRTFRQ